MNLRRFINQLLIASLVLTPMAAHAITDADRNAIDLNAIYYISDDGETACTSASAGATSTALSAMVPAPYHDIFAAAANAEGADPGLLATIFYVEHRGFPEPPPPYGNGKPWATSPAGAAGPFQFMPGTWTENGKGGNIQDLKDAAAAAARYIVKLGGKSGIPLGDQANPGATKPSVASVLASYNAGPAGNFANAQTVQYVQIGMGIYNKLTAPAGTANVSPGTTAVTGGPTIVLDPGHSGTSSKVTDAATGLIDYDYPNTPEMSEAYAIAQLVQSKLKADGYNVILTKGSESATVSLRARAEIANKANAALAVSIHNDHGQPWGSFAQVYTQKTGLYRSTAAGVKRAFPATSGAAATVADASAKAGSIMVTERSAAEGHAVSNTDANFDNRTGLSPGNIPLVMLFSKVPWIYNEVGAVGAGEMTTEHRQQYATGLINGIEKAVPLNGGAIGTTDANCQAAGAGSNDIVAVAKSQIGTKETPDGSNAGGGIQNDGKTVDSYTQNHPEFWCADFVSWVYFKAGKPFTGGASPAWRIPGAAAIANYMKKNGTWLDNAPGAANPAPGMIVYFNRSHSGAIGGANDHIGIVETADATTLKTIEGNSGNAVRSNTYTNYKSNNEIIGFGGLN